MADMKFNRRLFSLVLWVFSGLALLVLLTSCIEIPADPAATATPSATRTARPSATVTPSPLPHCIVSTGIDTGRLNIRAGAGLKSAVIRVLQEGDVLTIEGGKAGNWIRVVTGDDVTGWINKNFCKGKE
jgi:uncharacterized protein YgiM (DUF1202 family)